MRQPLNREQIERVSELCFDLAKIVFASAVVGFFIPGVGPAVNLPTFLTGGACASGLFVLSIALLKS
jgi:hypothetical protein